MRRLVLMMAVGCACAQVSSLDGLKSLGPLALNGTTYHVQGVDTDGKLLWVTSVDAPQRKSYLHEFAFDTGAHVRTVEVQQGARFHAGGLSLDGESLWLPVAEYRANSTATIERRSRRTLEKEFAFEVQDHIGCIAVTPEFVIGGNWDSRDFYVWSHKGELVRKVAMKGGNAYQDMKVTGGYLVASGLLADKTGAIDWLDLKTFDLVRRMTVGKTDGGFVFTREGMAVFGGQLLLLPEDGPSRLFRFALPR